MAYSSYTLTLTAEDSWPDIVFFNDDGTFHSYHSISGTENNENEIELPQEASAMYYYIGIWADAGDVTFYNLVSESNFDGDLIEDAFAGGDLNGWMGTASGNGATSPGTVYDQDIEKWVVEFDSKPAMYLPENERLWVSLSRTVDSPVPMGLSFSIKTDIGTNVDTAMVLYIDDLRTDSWNGLGGSWARKTFIIDAGSHELKWVLEKDKGNYYESATNKVWIGNVSLIPDVTDSVVLYPRADQETYAGGHTIQYTAKALRSDGSVRSNAGGFVFTGSGSGGSVDSNGLFTPSAGGTYTVSVSQDGKTASAGTITVHPGDYLRRPYTYPGTGQTYTGYSGSEGSLTTDGGVTISYPAETSFSADGFFTLEGSVNNPDVYNYVYVQVTKGGLETYYLLRDTFKTRIWLRFGAGSYTVRVWGYSQISLSPDLGAEGDFISGSYYQNPIIFTVTNTRDEAGVDEADRRFLYPSFIVQSDDFRVTNLAADLTYGITDLREKARAVHDHLVTNTVYDGDSYPGTNRRKKQDALTVLRTRYHIDGQYEPAGHYLAVCEGYANASAALLRAAGIETKYLLSSPMNHAWNNVYIDGWKFYDATWDDPVPNSGVIADYGPGYVRHKYFLLDSMTGVDNDHYGDEAVPGRYIGFRPTPPRQKGVPDGWY
jgi:transglutaminase-like putative cysteine protease